MAFRWPHRWPSMAPDAFSKDVGADHEEHGFSDLFVAEQDDRDRYLEDYLDRLAITPLVVGARVSQNVATNISGAGSGAVTLVDFQVVQFDTSSFFDGVSKFTVPAGLGGKYVVAGQITYTLHNDTQPRGTFIYVNGAQAQVNYSANVYPFHVRAGIYGWLELVAGDQVQLYGYDETGVTLATVTGPQETWFGLQLIGS